MTSQPRTLGRSIEYLRAFRVERDEPSRLYTLLASDAVETVQSWHTVAGARVLDVGGGPGYVADAFARAGATCCTVDPSSAELHLHGRRTRLSVVADGQRLPFADEQFDVVHCSNVLEHVPDPRLLLSELARCSAAGGLVYLSFTNWLSPWGGHEISPWHYFGVDLAMRRYERKGGTVKNRPGEGLFKLRIGDVVEWLRRDDRLEVLSTSPRYYPSWAAMIVRVPGVREVLTWNLEVVLRRHALPEGHR